jgi:outer membrane protein assembly factor BamB
MPVFVDGRIYIAGGGDIWWGKNEAWLKCIDATGAGDITSTAQIWSYPLNRHVMSTAAVYHDMVFIADVGKTVHCLDAAAGKPYWTHELRGEIWASPYVADGKVYIGSRRGDFLIFAAEKEKKILSSIDLKNPISATAVAANGTLFVSTMTDLYAVKKN